jgi:type III restriction enzyme
MPFELREYQRRGLDVLDRFLTRAAAIGAKAAFEQTAGHGYREVGQLPGLPYVCLRVPTGGGKTIMAAHAVRSVAKSFLAQEHVVAVWLVPSNTIRDQTLARLRDLSDPYRQALDTSFGGRVTVMDINEALYVQRGVLETDTCVIVATLAAFRVEDTEGRRVYEQNDNLASHFSGLPGQLRHGLERTADGEPVPSLANVLRLHAPVIIMDEAHNARTPLSFDTLARLNPSCIVEFTATPVIRQNTTGGNEASNVLYHVSASELKAEHMIKLPVRLRTMAVWKEAVAAALAKQRELEAAANAERALTGEYLRPIVLFQAQSRAEGDARVTVDVLRAALEEDFNIPQNQVAEATGARRELEGVDLTAETCPIRFIITVQALREGWDCPSAYVLCSVADMSSATAVEQILGRVLRMPRASEKRDAALNCAYAFAVSQHFAVAATGLRDALIENGFEKIEANAFVEPEPAGGQILAPGLFTPITGVVSAAPDLSLLTPEQRAQTTFDSTTSTLAVVGDISDDFRRNLERALPPEDRHVVRQMYEGMHARVASAADKPTRFAVPQLAVRVAGHLDLFTGEHLTNVEWHLRGADAHISPEEFSIRANATGAGDIDISASGKIEVTFRDRVVEQLSLLQGEPGWTVPRLAVWLDRQFEHWEIPQEDSTLFIHRSLTALMEDRGLTLDQLALHKFRLAKALAAKIGRYRVEQLGRAFQQSLFGPSALPIEVSPDLALTFDASGAYEPNGYYDGAFQFPRHLFRLVGAMNTEELQCAMRIEQHPNTAVWVRNIEGRPASSFWLQTSTDRFYPDFVGRTKDGRTFAIEYKGSHLWSNADSQEKRAVGDLWAARSAGRCVFVMPNGPDWAVIDETLGSLRP